MSDTESFFPEITRNSVPESPGPVGGYGILDGVWDDELEQELLRPDGIVDSDQPIKGTFNGGNIEDQSEHQTDENEKEGKNIRGYADDMMEINQFPEAMELDNRNRNPLVNDAVLMANPEPLELEPPNPGPIDDEDLFEDPEPLEGVPLEPLPFVYVDEDEGAMVTATMPATLISTPPMSPVSPALSLLSPTMCTEDSPESDVLSPWSTEWCQRHSGYHPTLAAEQDYAQSDSDKGADENVHDMEIESDSHNPGLDNQEPSSEEDEPRSRTTDQRDNNGHNSANVPKQLMDQIQQTRTATGDQLEQTVANADQNKTIQDKSELITINTEPKQAVTIPYAESDKRPVNQPSQQSHKHGNEEERQDESGRKRQLLEPEDLAPNNIPYKRPKFQMPRRPLEPDHLTPAEVIKMEANDAGIRLARGRGGIRKSRVELNWKDYVISVSMKERLLSRSLCQTCHLKLLNFIRGHLEEYWPDELSRLAAISESFPSSNQCLCCSKPHPRRLERVPGGIVPKRNSIRNNSAAASKDLYVRRKVAARNHIEMWLLEQNGSGLYSNWENAKHPCPIRDELLDVVRSFHHRFVRSEGAPVPFHVTRTPFFRFEDCNFTFFPITFFGAEYRYVQVPIYVTEQSNPPQPFFPTNIPPPISQLNTTYESFVTCLYPVNNMEISVNEYQWEA